MNLDKVGKYTINLTYTNAVYDIDELACMWHQITAIMLDLADQVTPLDANEIEQTYIWQEAT